MNLIKGNKPLLFILILFCIWLSISFIRLSYNVEKIFTQELSWITLTDDQKRNILYGDNAIIFPQVATKTQSSILLLSKSAESYFLGRYYLYPQKIYWISDFKKIKNNNENYILIYHPDEFKNTFTIKYYTKISIKYQNRVVAILYKIK